MSMTTEDMNYRKAAAKYLKCKQEQERRCNQHVVESTGTTATVVLSSEDSSDDNSLQPSTSSYEPPPRVKTSKHRLPMPLPKRCVIDNPLFNAALDRTQVTTHQAMMIVTPALAAAGIDVISYLCHDHL